MPVLYTAGLLVLFIALVIAELLVPSGGLLTVGALVAAVSAVLVAFTVSLNFGLSVVLAMLLLTPILLNVLLRFWPQTAMGRQTLNRRSMGTVDSVPPLTTIDGFPLDELVGRYGVAASHLLPAGQVLVDGHKVNAVSAGMPIDAGQPIKVVRIQARKLQVRLATSDELPSSSPSDDAAPTITTSESLDQMNLDDMDVT